jgi:hypothetical protein
MPIVGFTVSTSRRVALNRWNNYQLVAFGIDGRFAIVLDDAESKYGIRIEADGYFPDSSQSVNTGKGDQNLEFALTPGDGPSGVVVLQDGLPAVGAKVWLFGGNNLIFDGVFNGTKTVAGNAVSSITMEARDQFKNSSDAYDSTASVTTDSTGRFLFNPMSDAHTIIVSHDWGFAIARVEQLAVSPTLILEPWGRVEGTLWIGGNPGARQTIALSKGTVEKELNSLPPNFNLALKAQTDAEGKFVFPQVPAGMQMTAHVMGHYVATDLASVRVINPSTNTNADPAISRRIGSMPVGLLEPQAAGNVETQVRPVLIKAGETTSITVGGAGRPVIGRIVVTGAESPIDWNASENPHFLTLILPQPARPAAPEALSAYLQSEEYRNFYQAQRRCGFEIAPNGSFRIEDVPAGTYRLTIMAGLPIPQVTYDPSRPEANPTMSARQSTLGRIVQEFSVPEMPGGRSDVPFDIGIVTLTINRK